ncbi:MAG TPA: DUF1565 domain-containing protein [Ktedonobacteraceae bacterium]|nr:DUF1565 domain-containing protein [Ktedonobacteraceae bacterium]
MTQYYVATNGNNNNPGTQTQPFATITYAAKRCAPGDTVHVAAGVYASSVETYTSGLAGARITYLSDTRWGAKIVGNSDNSWYNEGNYVDIVGFDMTNGATGHHGINNYGSFVSIRHNRVHDILPTSCPSVGGAGIFQGGFSRGTQQSNVDLISNVIGNVGPQSSCTIVHGIYHTCTGGTLANNIVYGISGYGIHLWQAATKVTVSDNLVFACRYGGILIGNDGSRSWAPVDDSTIVSDNIVYHDSNYGIREYGSTGIHNRYLNNCVLGQSTNVLLQHGLRASDTVSSDPQFVNYQADGTGDYHLKSSSPCIGEGTAIGAFPSDFDSNPRPPLGTSRYDIGPYVYMS